MELSILFNENMAMCLFSAPTFVSAAWLIQRGNRFAVDRESPHPTLPFLPMQEALETLIVRIIEEKVEQVVSSALACPNVSFFPDTTEQIQVLDLYLQTLKPMHALLLDFCSKVQAELPTKSAATSASIDDLLTVLQV
jgi:hypothetical protein